MFYTIYTSSVFHMVDLNNNWLFPYEVSSTQHYATFRACLHGGGGPQVGKVTRLGGVTLRGALGYFLGGYVPPGTPNWYPVLEKISPKIDTLF